MNDKSTNFVAKQQHIVHQLPAGLLKGDTRTELFGCRDTNRVYAISNGVTLPFSKLLAPMKSMILERLLDDPKAMEDLKGLTQEEAVEKYAFCVFGAADSEADFCNEGKLGAGDNFICGNNCRCLSWESKSINVDGNRLTPREIEIVQLMSTDMPDKHISESLGISISTLNTHKAHIFEKFSVYSKTGVARKAIEQKIVQ
jgi:DNA-binding CsgD family transcriptional regulator